MTADGEGLARCGRACRRSARTGTARRRSPAAPRPPRAARRAGSASMAKGRPRALGVRRRLSGRGPGAPSPTWPGPSPAVRGCSAARPGARGRDGAERPGRPRPHGAASPGDARPGRPGRAVRGGRRKRRRAAGRRSARSSAGSRSPLAGGRSRRSPGRGHRDPAFHGAGAGHGLVAAAAAEPPAGAVRGPSPTGPRSACTVTPALGHRRCDQPAWPASTHLVRTPRFMIVPVATLLPEPDS